MTQLNRNPHPNQVERALVINPSLMRCCSIRPMFLGSCVVACKMTRDNDLRLPYLHCLLMDVFNLLEVGLLVKLEHQLLEVRHASHGTATPHVDLPPTPCQHNSNRFLNWTAVQTIRNCTHPQPLPSLTLA